MSRGQSEDADAEQAEAPDAESDDRAERNDPPVSLSPAGKSSVLWAAIGALAFLVLIQGFELWSGERVSFLVKFAVAAVVALVAGGATYLLQGRVPPANEGA